MEEPCCICGEWSIGPKLLDESLLRNDVKRKHVAGLLNEKHLCIRCVSRCDGCKKVIIYAQKKVAKGLCEKCSAKINKKKS
jgi:hypothetical protein